jgi:hypothetical protein
MIETGVDPFEFTPTDRINLYYDTDQYDLEWIIGEEVGVYTMDIARNFNPIEQGKRTKDLDRLLRNLKSGFRTDWRERKARAIELYMNLAGLNYHYATLRGHSQGDWAEVIIYSDPDDRVDLESCAEAMNDWFAGEVFTIVHEKLHTYTDSLNPISKIERWEIEDSIGSILPVKGQDFENMAEVYFGHLWENKELTVA